MSNDLKPASASPSSDVTIIGAGIVGLAFAYKLSLAQPALRIRVLEKESGVARHQSGRNSGVLHSGIYYKPGSLKARTCVDGKRQMEEFCEREGIRWRKSGKVIVATSERELPMIATLLERGEANGVSCRRLSADELREIEPHCAGIAGIHVPSTGVVDYIGVCERIAAILRSKGHEVTTGAEARAIELRDTSAVVHSGAGDFESRWLVNCAGLHSDTIASMAGEKPPVRIIPFRGEYYSIGARAASFCRTLIYPVPDPQFPFLGVHFTRGFDDQVHCGPNAVLAWQREGYRRADISPRDLLAAIGHPGFRKLARRHWKMGLGEMWRSVSKRAFVNAAQRLVPEVRIDDFAPAPAGVRAQAIAADGALVDDFAITRRGRMLNVLNAPSPAATASLAIGDVLVREFRAMAG